MQLGKGALLRGWPSTAPLGFQPGSQGTGVLVRVRGSQAMVAPSTSLDCAWFPSPCAALLHMSSEECTQLKCLRDLYLLAGKRLGQLSLPVAKEAVKKTGGSPWSAPGICHFWDPTSWASQDVLWKTLSMLHSCPHGFALQGTTAPKALRVAALGSALVCQ